MRYALTVEMLASILLLMLLFLLPKSGEGCGTTISDSRIVGGEDTGGYHYPWFALLRLRTTGDPPVCAGSLISPSYILTAAHCFSIFPGKPKENLFTVALGTYNRCAASEPTRQIFSVTHVDIHERYSSSSKFFDIALMKLDRTADFPIVCLPIPGGVVNSEPGLLVGFGVTKQGNRVLPCHQRQARVTKYSSEQCADTRLPAEDAHEPTVFCAGGQGIDSCQGDSGGPFLTQTPDGRYIVSGIVSYGYGCAKIGLPGIYTNVASYLNWINTKMSQTQNNLPWNFPLNNQFNNHSIKNENKFAITQPNPISVVRNSIPSQLFPVNKNKNEVSIIFPANNMPQKQLSIYFPSTQKTNPIIFPNN